MYLHIYCLHKALYKELYIYITPNFSYAPTPISHLRQALVSLSTSLCILRFSWQTRKHNPIAVHLNLIKRQIFPSASPTPTATLLLFLPPPYARDASQRTTRQNTKKISQFQFFNFYCCCVYYNCTYCLLHYLIPTQEFDLDSLRTLGSIPYLFRFQLRQ